MSIQLYYDNEEGLILYSKMGLSVNLRKLSHVNYLD